MKMDTIVRILLFACLCGLTYSQCQGTVTKRGFTAAEQSLIVQWHNYYRNTIAGGWQKGFPQATNMNFLTWNADIAKYAQTWTNGCPMGHNPQVWGKYGENFFWNWASYPQLNVGDAVTTWYNEYQYFPRSEISNFQMQGNGGQMIGHFTQVIWAETVQVGCGLIQTNSNGNTSNWIFCDYYPAGNYMGSPVYKQGAYASQCKNGTAKVYVCLCSPATRLSQLIQKSLRIRTRSTNN